MGDTNFLVIDDEPVIGEITSTILKRMGYSATYALLGEEGVDFAAKQPFDIVITDLRLPDMDGIRVLEKLKAIDPDIVVIISTGYPSFESVHAALRAGAYDYVSKPFESTEFSFVIQRAVSYRKILIANKNLRAELADENVRLEQKVKARTADLRLVYHIARQVSSSLELQVVLNQIVDLISRTLKVETCSLLMFNKATGDLSIRAAQGLPDEIVKTTRISLTDTVSGWVFRQGEAILVEDIEKDARFSRRNQERYYTNSFISAPLIVKDKVIGVINVNNRKTREPFTKEELRLIKAITREVGIAIQNAELFRTLEESYLQTIKTLTSVIDAKDHYTFTHSENVTRYAVVLASELKLPSQEIDDIRNACQLHDLGKIGISDYILTKPGKLTDDEWREMKQHPGKAEEILKPLSFLSNVVRLVGQHHECYDGHGYPYGLRGEAIALGARIIALADSFDAMTSKRPYRNTPMTKEQAIEEVKRNSGTQFDPGIVAAFLSSFDKFSCCP